MRSIVGNVPGETPHDLPPAVNRIKLTIKQIGGHSDMILSIEKGYGDPIDASCVALVKVEPVPGLS